MSAVCAQLSMSLDGFVAGPDDRTGNGNSDGGERLHEWIAATAGWQHRPRAGRRRGDRGVELVA